MNHEKKKTAEKMPKSNLIFIYKVYGLKGRCIEVARHSTDCIGHYNFDHIVYFAKLRFIEGCSTISLLQLARSDTEREEVAMVCMLDIEDELVLNIKLNCRYANDCKMTNCRDRLRSLLEAELKSRKLL